VNLSEELTKISELEKNVIDNSVKSILRYCEEDENAKEFVKIIINHNFPGESVESYKRSALIMAMYKLGYEFHINEYHDTSSLYNLASFMANYFYDDSYYTFYEDNFLYGGVKNPDSEYEEQFQGAEPLLKWAEEKAVKEVEKMKKIRKKVARLKKLFNE
jgi:hypothetical protein